MSMLNIINLQCGIVTVRINTALYWYTDSFYHLIHKYVFNFIYCSVLSYHLIFQYLSIELVYINIVTVNKRIYIMVVMQLSVSIDCPFLIATFSSVYINLLHD
jgi:hypothetical protein